MIQKQGSWIPYELTRNVERRFFTCDFSHVKCCLPDINERIFLHHTVTGDEKWITMITQRRGNHGDHLTILQHWQPSRIFMEKTHVVYLVGSAWCRVLWVAQTERDHYWSSLPNTIDEIEPSTQGKTRLLLLQAWHTKLFSCMIMLDHVAAPVKIYLETLKWEVLPHPPYISTLLLPLVSIDDAWPVWAALHIWRYQKLYPWLGSLKRWSVLSTRYPHATRKMGKNSG